MTPAGDAQRTRGQNASALRLLTHVMRASMVNCLGRVDRAAHEYEVLRRVIFLLLPC